MTWSADGIVSSRIIPVGTILSLPTGSVFRLVARKSSSLEGPWHRERRARRFPRRLRRSRRTLLAFRLDDRASKKSRGSVPRLSLDPKENPDAELPRLVFVGMEGWGVAELMSDIRLIP